MEKSIPNIGFYDFNDELRLKHRASEYAKIPLADVMALLEKTHDFFEGFMKSLFDARCSFPKGYKITGRKSPKGHDLSSVDVIIDEETGVAIGFSSSDPLPIW